MTNTEEEPPPKPTDLDGWRRAIADGCYRAFRIEAVVAAIQDLGPDADKEVINDLACHVSDTMLRILRKHIGRNHRNEGVDLIEEAHGDLIRAMLKPDSSDGQGLREAFVPRVRFRAADAIRADKESRKRERFVEDLTPISDAKQMEDVGPQKVIDESLYVEEMLSRIPDERKRLAFRLYMDGIPFKSGRTPSISKALGVSSKTAEKWVEEVQAQLKLIVGEQS